MASTAEARIENLSVSEHTDATDRGSGAANAGAGDTARSRDVGTRYSHPHRSTGANSFASSSPSAPS
ncbi:MAG TPA: hypothetical protein VGM10_22140 [Actinocrinis sp.]